MLLRSCFALMLVLLCAGCQKSQDQQFTRFYDDGVAKPIVAICPVIDSTSHELPWSLSEEFTQLVVDFSSHEQSLYIPSKKAYKNPPRVQDNPFTGDLSWVKEQFAPHEFVVFLEVLEHSNQPVEKNAKHGPAIEANSSISSNLVTTFRIRIVDIRKEQPIVVLQEILHDSYYVTKSLIPIDYQEVSWGSAEYVETPLCIAHDRMARDIVERIHDYVLLAKSR